MVSIDTHEAVSDNLLASERASRNYNLDLMKIIACIAVVGLHTLQKELSVINSTLYYCCGFAVPVFFMCSGYVLLKRKGTTISYAIKKISSIFRVVLLWSLVIYAAEILVDIRKGQFELASFLDFPIIAAKSLLQKGYLWQFWYLGALMILYAVLPLLFKLKNKTKLVWAVCLTVGFGFQIVSYICLEPVQKYFIQTFRVWTWIQYFVLGGMLSERKTFLKKITVRQHGFLLIAVTALVIIYQNFMGRFALHNLYAEYFYDDILTLAWVIVLFAFMMRIELKARAVTVIQQLAPITMGVYIVHPLILRLANSVFVIDTVAASIAFFVGILVISAVVCTVMKRVPGFNRMIEI